MLKRCLRLISVETCPLAAGVDVPSSADRFHAFLFSATSDDNLASGNPRIFLALDYTNFPGTFDFLPRTPVPLIQIRIFRGKDSILPARFEPELRLSRTQAVVAGGWSFRRTHARLTPL